MTEQPDFEALVAANRRYAETAEIAGFDGIARAGVAIVTCMDSRIDPLAMVGLRHGDAKILRTPGGHVTTDALVGVVLSTHLLGVRRVMVIPHTRCAMASGTGAELAARVREAAGREVVDLPIPADPDWHGHLAADLDRLRAHPMLAPGTEIAGFLYDVDTGLLEPLQD